MALDTIVSQGTGMCGAFKEGNLHLSYVSSAVGTTIEFLDRMGFIKGFNFLIMWTPLSRIPLKIVIRHPLVEDRSIQKHDPKIFNFIPCSFKAKFLKH